MGITYSHLLEADFSALKAAGEAWMALYAVMDDQAGALVALKSNDDAQFGSDHWNGQSGEAARERVRDIVLKLDERASAARRVSVTIIDAVEEFEAAQSELNDLAAEAPSRGVSIADDGSVTTEYITSTQQQQQVIIVQEEINALLERATEADETLKVAVGIWAETVTESERLGMIAQSADEVEELQELIDSGASPEQINDWWKGLSEAERMGILEGSPELIAGLDGVPTDTRDAANRDLLDAEIDRYSPTLDGDIADLEARIAEMEANGEHQTVTTRDDPVHGTITSTSPTQEYLDLVAQLEGLQGEQSTRDSLASLQDAITGEAPSSQDYYLLGYDSADDGKAIVSVGNPDTADNTAVYVPGTGADLNGASGGLLERTETMASDANAIPGSGETAVVMWLGYDAPNNPVMDSPSLSYAEDASAPLTSFMSGLDSTGHDPEGTTTTVVGHSYGTTVIGQAASEHGLATDQIVAIASPGMTVDHASDLNIEPDNFYASTAPLDVINAAAETGALGADPTDTGTNYDGSQLLSGELPIGEGFGGHTFTSDNMDGNPVDIHSNYWDANNPARNNMALIFTGNGGEVT